MLGIFLAFVAVATALLVCLNAETLGRRFSVMDHPDTERKNHTEATPLVGGIGILLPLLIWLAGALLSGVVGDKQTLFVLMLGGAGVGLVGFADDQTPITPLSRILLVLVYLGVAFVISPDLIAKGLNWGSFEPTPLPGWAYCGLLAVTTIGIVNAVNMADGQNGLVPSMFVVWSLCLMLVGDGVVTQVAQILAVVSFVVLIFNVQGRLFLGDCGSYGVTFVIGLLGPYGLCARTRDGRDRYRLVLHTCHGLPETDYYSPAPRALAYGARYGSLPPPSSIQARHEIWLGRLYRLSRSDLVHCRSHAAICSCLYHRTDGNLFQLCFFDRLRRGTGHGYRPEWGYGAL